MVALRRVSAAVAGVLAAVLLPLSMVSVWVAGLVTDTDRYVATVGPLADDPTIRKAAIRVLDAEAVRLVDLGIRSPALVRYLKDHGYGKLATSGGRITAALQKEVAATVHSAVTAAVEGPHFKTVWKAANRTAHGEMVKVLSDDDDALVDPDGRVTVELGTVLNTVADTLQEQGLVPPGALPKPKTSFTLVKTDDLADAQRAYRTLDALGFWLPVAWLVTFVLAIVLSRRKVRTTRLMLFTSVVGVLALIVGIDLLGNSLADSTPDPDVTSTVWERITHGLRLALLVTTLFAGAVFTWFSSLVPNRAGQPPSRTATLTARIAAGVLVAVAVVLAVTR